MTYCIPIPTSTSISLTITAEEMLAIFDDQAEFTINGRTSLLKGTGTARQTAWAPAMPSTTQPTMTWNG